MKRLNYILLLIPFLFSSCEKEIDFKYNDIPEQQVIEGLLTQDGVNICLTRTIPTDEPFNDKTLADAVVLLSDLSANKSYTLIPDSRGNFTIDGLIGETGHDYELTVMIEEKVYTSTSRMLEPTEIISAEFNWIEMPNDDVAMLKVMFVRDADSHTEYWLRVYRNGKPYAWQSLKSLNSQDGVVTGMMKTTRRNTDKEDDDKVLKDGDMIDIEVMPISPKMGEYLRSLNNGDYNGNQMFDGSYCLGYFLAAPIAHTRLFFHPDSIQAS